MPLLFTIILAVLTHAEALLICFDLVLVLPFLVFGCELVEGATSHYATIRHVFHQVWIFLYHFLEAELPTLVDLNHLSAAAATIRR